MPILLVFILDEIDLSKFRLIQHQQETHPFSNPRAGFRNWCLSSIYSFYMENIYMGDWKNCTIGSQADPENDSQSQYEPDNWK
jgi:hypothetical protein